MRLILLSSFFYLAGCAFNCTEIGCSGSLSVYLAGATADGEWSLELTKDGVTRACTVSLPGGEPVCSDPLDVEVDSGGMNMVWTTAMGEAGEEVQVRVSHDGLLLVDESFVPDWSEPYYPNGKACDDGFGCVTASADFSVE